mmetsp:Transcript_23804/g.42844  ORF Transcript_23804/g.42844 Transcript_23804/m.42844 type:complete len:106 (+) Transcript_23804:52-369(+)
MRDTHASSCVALISFFRISYSSVPRRYLITTPCTGFLYLACVTILPDVLETNVSMPMRLLQVGSFLLGVAFMYGVALLEEMEASNHGEHHHGHHHSSDEHVHSEL